MSDPDRRLRTILQAIELFKATPGRRGRIIHLEGASEVLVAGDMHGNLRNFRLLLQKAKLHEHPQRHLVVQEVIHGTWEYPNDGGDKSHQLLDLIAALKCERPNQTHFLLGNHELAQWVSHPISKGDRDPLAAFKQGVQTAYGKKADMIYAAYEELFRAVPLALRTANRVFLSHSLPTAAKQGLFDPALLEREHQDETELRTGGGVHALVWGRDNSAANAAAFLRKVDADLLITGHVPAEGGFQAPNEQQLVLDSMRDGDAACCLFPADRPLTHQELLACVCPLDPAVQPK